MLLITHSENRKLGGMAATYRGKQTCPEDCALYKACYAKQGHANIAFIRATKHVVENDGKQLFEWFKSLPVATTIRHFVSGDFSLGEKADGRFIVWLRRAHKLRKDIKGFGYTHSWKRLAKNPFTGMKNLVINASCDRIEDIQAARDKGFDTVIVVPENTPAGKIDYHGHKLLVCPNQISKKLIAEGKKAVEVTCKTCMLCAKSRDFTIGFIAHGASKGKVAFD